jgi:hypothetical protein
MIKNMIMECDYDNYQGEWKIRGSSGWHSFRGHFINTLMVKRPKKIKNQKKTIKIN